MREAYQSKIGQRILTSSLRVHLSPNFRESWLQQQQQLKPVRLFSLFRTGSLLSWTIFFLGLVLGVIHTSAWMED